MIGAMSMTRHVMRKPEPVRVVPGPRLIYLTHDPTIGKGSLVTAGVSAVADLAGVIFVRDAYELLPGLGVSRGRVGVPSAGDGWFLPKPAPRVADQGQSCDDLCSGR